MTRQRLAFGILAIAAVAGLVTWAGSRIQPPIPSPEVVWIPKNAHVLDSAQVHGSEKAFVFQYDLGAFGYSVAMVSLHEPSHLAPFLLLKGSPTHVWWTTPDTLMVEVQSDSNKLFAPLKGIIVIPTHAAKPAR